MEKLIQSVTVNGNFTLSGGDKSNVYYDVKKLIMEPSLLTDIITTLEYNIAYHLAEDYVIGDYPKSIGGVETGSIPLITALSLRMKLPGFYVRKHRKNYGLNKLVEGNLISPCILVEDVLTTGHSIIDAIDYIQEKDVEVLAVFPIVDRNFDNSIETKLTERGVKLFPLYKAKQKLNFNNNNI